MKREKTPLPTAPKTLAVLRALHRGERLTVFKAITKLHVAALSQECGRLRRLGWNVKSEMKKTGDGTRIAEYSL